MQIPFFDGRAAFTDIEDRVLQAVQRVLRSGQFILGPEVLAFEQAFATLTGARFAVAVASGTDALSLALRAAGVVSGEQVLTVPNTAPATAAAIQTAGCRPVFSDVHPDTLLMCPEQAEQQLKTGIRAIIPVHLYGQPAPLDQLVAVAKAAGVVVIEDCAHAAGAFDQGLHVGRRGDIGCFSFYPTKPLGGMGDGGICITDSEQLATRLRALRMYSFNEHRICMESGFNSRLDEVQAAILHERLHVLEQHQQHRQKLADRYIAGLQKIGLRMPQLRTGITHAWHQFVVRVPQRKKLMESLRQMGVGTAIHYEHSLHLMPAFADSIATRRFPNAEQAATEVLSLPCSQHVSEADADQIVEVMIRCLP